MLGYGPMMAPLSLGGDRSRISLGQVVTSECFTMLGVRPFLGRMLVPSDDDPDRLGWSSLPIACGSASSAPMPRLSVRR